VTSGAAPPLLFDYDNFPPDAYQVACAACTMCLCSPMLLPMQSWSAPQALRSIVRIKGSGGASQYTYPAPGKPELARHVVDLLRRAGAPAAASSKPPCREVAAGALLLDARVSLQSCCARWHAQRRVRLGFTGIAAWQASGDRSSREQHARV